MIINFDCVYMYEVKNNEKIILEFPNIYTLLNELPRKMYTIYTVQN